MNECGYISRKYSNYYQVLFKNADKIMNIYLFSFLFHQDKLTPADEREGRAVKTVFKQNQVNQLFKYHAGTYINN